ncbi:hypothetical protein [Streptomyces mirabilis]|uniref:hypothetical protein n=1 Tax=Streptomyces mirabilis TaxID=68239 RepID=UPI0033AD3132
MWSWDGEFICSTHTTARQKYKNIAHEPRVAISIVDPDQPYRHTEVRGIVDHIDADPEAKMYQRLSSDTKGLRGFRRTHRTASRSQYVRRGCVFGQEPPGRGGRGTPLRATTTARWTWPSHRGAPDGSTARPDSRRRQ